MNHQQHLIVLLAGTVFIIGALVLAGGVAMRRLAWVATSSGIVLAAGIYAYIHWYR